METEIFANLLAGLDGLETMVCIGCLVCMFIIVNRTVPKINEFGSSKEETEKEESAKDDDNLRSD